MIRSLVAIVLLVFISLDAPHTAAAPTAASELAELPTVLPPLGLNAESSPNGNQGLKPLTLVPELQNTLQGFIRDKGNPITAVVLVEVRTGRILAMAQGRAPERWGATTHTALHNGFPAASLFKTVVTAAAFEYADISATAPIGLVGGCSHVHPTGAWMRDDRRVGPNAMTLRRAYGHSCNGFFAKLAINHVGLGPIVSMSKRFGWDPERVEPIADFRVTPSPIHPPNAETSSAYTVGRFAAGFGAVGLSPVHAAWQAMLVANNGAPRPLKIFADGLGPIPASPGEALISPSTARKIREVMDATIMGGTASSAFRNYRYKNIRLDMGGKTGTLTGSNPAGLTSWFIGLYPLEKPEIAVASVVLLEDLWIFKAPTLAAEAVLAYHTMKGRGEALSSVKLSKKAKRRSLARR